MILFPFSLDPRSLFLDPSFPGNRPPFGIADNFRQLRAPRLGKLGISLPVLLDSPSERESKKVWRLSKVIFLVCQMQCVNSDFIMFATSD